MHPVWPEYMPTPTASEYADALKTQIELTTKKLDEVRWWEWRRRQELGCRLHTLKAFREIVGTQAINRVLTKQFGVTIDDVVREVANTPAPPGAESEKNK